MIQKTDLEFSYTPTDLFEGAMQLELTGFGSATIDAGKAIVTLLRPTNPVPRPLLDKVTNALRTVFEARSIITRRDFALGLPNATHYEEDGRRHAVIYAEGASMIMMGLDAHVQITDASGTVIVDSRLEKQRAETAFIERVAAKAPQSLTLQRMLQSFRRSITDPANELVHLYELLDAARKHYGSELAARQALQITKKEWSTLGELANHRPLREGRHRGEHLDGLRSATPDELATARIIARKILEAFLNTL